jgi:hypothetical protein
MTVTRTTEEVGIQAEDAIQPLVEGQAGPHRAGDKTDQYLLLHRLLTQEGEVMRTAPQVGGLTTNSRTSPQERRTGRWFLRSIPN